MIVINEAAAAALFGTASPLGRRLQIFSVDTEVAGVVRDAKYDSVRKNMVPTMFLPYMQTAPPLTLGPMHVVVRTNAAPAAVAEGLRSAVADVDRDVPVSRLKTETAQIQDSLSTELAFTRLLKSRQSSSAWCQDSRRTCRRVERRGSSRWTRSAPSKALTRVVSERAPARG